MKKLQKSVIALLLASMAASVIGCNADTGNDTTADTTVAEVTAPLPGNSKLQAFAITANDNPWLMWDIDFRANAEGTEFTAVSGHPHLVGQTFIPRILYTGTKLAINGVEYTSGAEVVLNEVNTVTVYDGDEFLSEYTVSLYNTGGGIPTVIIDTDGADIPDKLNYVDASVTIIGTEDFADDIHNAAAGIKLRGNSTMGYAKKPYRLKFEEKQEILGIAKAKSWVLLANYLDPASMRGQLAFGLAARINADTAEQTGYTVFSPRIEPVEVYLNGEYMGLYDMGDHIQADKTRVAIDESGDDGSTETDIGYFIEIEVMERVLREGADGYEDWSAYSFIENVGAYGTNQNNQLYFQFKLPEEPTDEQKAYITDYMQKVNDLILAHDEAVLDYIDLDSFIDWYLVNELFKNTDSHMQSSVYLFKDKGGKLFMGPVWDFDLSSGSQTNLGLDDPTGYWTSINDYCGWFKALYEMDTFTSALKARWADLRENGIIDAIFTDMDEFIAYAGDSALADYSTWNESYVNVVASEDSMIGVPEVVKSGKWEDQVNHLRTFLEKRIDWLDVQYGYVKAAA